MAFFIKVICTKTLLFLCVVSATTSIQAAPVTYNFSGVITNYTFNTAFTSDPFGSSIGPGTMFTGSYTYDPNEQLGSTVSSTSTTYRFFTSSSSMNVQIASLDLTNGDNNSRIVITNDFSGSDSYLAQSVSTGAGVGAEVGSIPESIIGDSLLSFGTILLSDSTGAVFTNMDLPETLPSLDMFDNPSFFWGLESSMIDCPDPDFCNEIITEIYTFEGTLSSLSVSSVPVPAAVWLFGSGLIGLIGVARKKKA